MPNREMIMRSEKAGAEQFARQTLNFMSNLLGVDSIAFYHIDDETRESRFRLLNVPASFLNDYLKYAGDLDPLSPVRAQSLGGATALLSNELGESDGDREYHRFMRLHGFRDTIELFFRCNGQMVGGLSVLLNDCSAVPDRRTELLQRCRIAQPYIEHNIASGPQSSAIRIREWLANDHGLSKREVAVAELVAAGRCNKMIGGDLSIAVTTVKTHLVHIFDKVGVDSRAALIAKINAFSS